MKILVVDDSRTMRKIIRNALEGMGYSPASVVEASDGVEAMAKLREYRFRIDIILADWNMPNMDGLSLLKELQGVEELSHIPVIMVTGEAQRDRVVEAIRAGARNYIVKPFTPETLRQKVLAIEMELLARRKPTDTAVIRIEAAKATAKPDADLPFLAQLPEELVAGIYECARMTEHAPGEALVEPDDVVESLHIVDRGEVEILAGTDGRGQARAADVRGRGECVGEISFLSGDPAGLSARAKTDIAIASVEKGEFEDLLAEHPHLSFYLTRLLAKCARKADAKIVADLESGLSGKLSMMALAELVQTLHTSQKTGLLRVKSVDEEGDIHIVDGNVRHARRGDTSGEEAFYQLLTWAEGSFAFETNSHEIEPTIFRATMGLLMEGMRRQDELRKMRA
ncbi:MAG: response regulator [Planctomycetota bacterium]|jgi:two-component system chemotaxis response regulator CheY